VARRQERAQPKRYHAFARLWRRRRRGGLGRRAPWRRLCRKPSSPARARRGPAIGPSRRERFRRRLDIEGSQPSNRVGDAQGISNIAGPTGFKLHEAWLQYNFRDARASALAGLYDLNTEFYRLRSASLFLNSSFGIGAEFAQSGVAGPSIFPETAVGLRLACKPAPDVTLRAAVLDGVPLDRPGGGTGIFEHGDGALLVGEAAFLDRPGPGEEPQQPLLGIGRASKLPPYGNKFAIGVWHYTAEFRDLSATAANGTAAQHRGSSGAYAILDRLLIAAEGENGWRVNGFLQAGRGDERVDRFGSYIGAGLAATGLIDARPDLQYIVHPNTDPTPGNALVLQFQCSLSF
jgi:porin